MSKKTKKQVVPVVFEPDIDEPEGYANRPPPDVEFEQDFAYSALMDGCWMAGHPEIPIEEDVDLVDPPWMA